MTRHLIKELHVESHRLRRPEDRSPRPSPCSPSKGDRARVLAGGTDIIVQLREGRRDVDCARRHQAHPRAQRADLRSAKQGLRIGAAVPCYRIYEHAEIAASLSRPDRRRLADRRHPDPEPGQRRRQPVQRLAGRRLDPALIALEAVCVIAGPEGTREVPVEQFCTGAGHATCCSRGELLVALQLPPPAAATPARAYLRFIPRNEMDIAVVGAGVARDARRRQTTLHGRAHRPRRRRPDAAAGAGGRRGPRRQAADRRRLIDKAGDAGPGRRQADQRHARRRRLSQAPGRRAGQAGAANRHRARQGETEP